MPPQQYPVGAISQLLILTDRRVQQLVKDGILPRPTKGVYDPISCVHAYIEYLRRLIAGSGELSLTEERTRLTKLQADLAELQLRKAHGELINGKKATRVWDEIITAARQKLLGLSTRLAPQVATSQSIPEIKDRIDISIYEILNELSSPNLESIARSESSLIGFEGLPAPTKAHRESVGRRKKKAKPRVKRRARKVVHRESGVPKRDDGRIQRPTGGDGDTDNLKPGGKDGSSQ